MMLFALVLNQTKRNWQSLQVSRGRGTNWLRFNAAELLTMRRWCCSTSVKELEVEDWVDSLPLRAPPPSQASCDGGRGARVLLARELAGLWRRLATAAHGWSPRAGGGTRAVRGWSSRAAVAGKGRLRLQRGSRLLAVVARVGSKCVSEWLSQTVPTGVIPTSVLVVGLRARQERY
jgi:hypothetical protein